MAFVYDEEKLARLATIMGEHEGNEVPYDVVEAVADEFMFPTRSVGAKLRALGAQVAKKNSGKTKWPEVEANVLAEMVEAGQSDVEIAERLGKTVKQVRGKALSMKLMDKLVRITQPTENTKTFTEEQEAVIATMQADGAYLEDIAAALDKNIRQIRGKLLSMKLTAPQRDKKVAAAKIYNDEVLAMVTAMVEAGDTAEAIATAMELNLTGLKSKLGKMGLKTPDMGGKSKGYSEEDYATLEAMIADGADAEAIGAAIGRTAQSVRIVAGKRALKFAAAAVAEAA